MWSTQLRSWWKRQTLRICSIAGVKASEIPFSGVFRREQQEHWIHSLCYCVWWQQSHAFGAVWDGSSKRLAAIRVRLTAGKFSDITKCAITDRRFCHSSDIVLSHMQHIAHTYLNVYWCLCCWFGLCILHHFLSYYRWLDGCHGCHLPSEAAVNATAEEPPIHF